MPNRANGRRRIVRALKMEGAPHQIETPWGGNQENSGKGARGGGGPASNSSCQTFTPKRLQQEGEKKIGGWGKASKGFQSVPVQSQHLGGID